jgi:transcriptional regulator with PAS, ATPase and Fis domain
VIGKIAPSDVTVLVRGDSGSGKELVARAIHALSPRAKGPMRAINCAAVAPTLLESELFGHAKGAFTGAVRDAAGHFRLADHGTLFLDEVAEMPPDLQAKMLRVLETREILPIGARDAVSVDVRIIAATHRSLRKEVEQGRFRADLMYRLRVIPIFLPPLHARGNDVLLIARKLIDEMNLRASRTISQIAPSAAAALTRYGWPGNIRELRNALEYAYAIGEGPVLLSSDLPPELTTNEATDAEANARANVAPVPETADHGKEAERILRAIERSSGNRDRAAKILGISRITLWRRIKALRLRV